MTPYSFVWLTLGAFLVYVVAQDGNVYDWLVLKSRHLYIWFQRKWYQIRYHPDSPWVRYEIDRNARKFVDEMQKEMREKEQSD